MVQENWRGLLTVEVKMPVELINEQMKELCPIVITTIDCLLGRPAIGRNGLYEYSKEEDLIKHEGKLCEKYCDEWNQELSFWGRRLGHNYQKEDKALEYYLTNMKEHCDIVKC